MRYLIVGLVILLCGCGLSREDAVEYLGENRDGLLKVRNEFEAVVPDSQFVRIEFVGRRSIDFNIFNTNVDSTEIQMWDASLESVEVKQGLALLGWDRAKLDQVRQMVESVDGIGIEGPFPGRGIRIRYRRSSMGLYSFMVSDSAMVASDEMGYDGCSTYYFDTRTALMYGGPAFGSDCMPAFERW